MDAVLTEWLGLALRWIHVITAIAWIGSSFFFMWLDSHLRPPETARRGIFGELWMVHSGGFYEVAKYQVAPEAMPATLHWFKWEAYFTWISGFLLLTLLYYFGAETYLIPPGSDLSPWAAVAIGIGTLVVGWVVYDALCRSPLGRNDALLGAVCFLFAAGASWALTQVFTGRGAFIHVGAMLATIMAANVFMVIIPSQRNLVRATLEGRERDPAQGKRAKQRSVHNNYLTLPVLFTMISNHYPSTFAPSHNWLILIGLSLVGAGARHYFNRRNAGANPVWILPAAAAGMIALAFVATPQRPAVESAEASGAPDVTFASVHAIIGQRCTACHSARPTMEGFDAPPKGMAFDTPEEIRSRAALIHAQTVATDVMPLGNVTNMTPEERAILGRWVAAGAPVE